MNARRNRRIVSGFPRNCVRRNNEEALPQMIAAGADERVREQPTHAVADHDDPLRREIVIVRIDAPHGVLELLAQAERIQKNRGAGTIIEVPELVIAARFPDRFPEQ